MLYGSAAPGASNRQSGRSPSYSLVAASTSRPLSLEVWKAFGEPKQRSPMRAGSFRRRRVAGRLLRHGQRLLLPHRGVGDGDRDVLRPIRSRDEEVIGVGVDPLVAVTQDLGAGVHAEGDVGGGACTEIDARRRSVACRPWRNRCRRRRTARRRSSAAPVAETSRRPRPRSVPRGHRQDRRRPESGRGPSSGRFAGEPHVRSLSSRAPRRRRVAVMGLDRRLLTSMQVAA